MIDKNLKILVKSGSENRKPIRDEYIQANRDTLIRTMVPSTTYRSTEYKGTKHRAPTVEELAHRCYNLIH